VAQTNRYLYIIVTISAITKFVIAIYLSRRADYTVIDYLYVIPLTDQIYQFDSIQPYQIENGLR